VEGHLARWIEKLQQFQDNIGRVYSMWMRTGCLGGHVQVPSVDIALKLKRRKHLNKKGLHEWFWRRTIWSRLASGSVAISGYFSLSSRKGSWCTANLARDCQVQDKSKGTTAKVYWSYWDSLKIQSGILYKRRKTPNLKNTVIQLIVPKSRINQILDEAHDSPSGGRNLELIKLWRIFEKDSIGHPVSKT